MPAVARGRSHRHCGRRIHIRRGEFLCDWNLSPLAGEEDRKLKSMVRPDAHQGNLERESEKRISYKAYKATDINCLAAS